jgi:signal transduction histidine kinase
MINIFSVGAISKAEFESCVSSINTQIQAVNELIENILFWASRQLNGIAIKKEIIDLNKIVNEHLLFFNMLSERKKINLTSNLNGSVFILADRDIICLVLRNLLANAIKFSNTEGKILIDCMVDDSKVWLCVKDSGIGMSDETLKSIFKSNCGTKSIDGTNNEKGTGLGLSLCKEYLEKMEAEIRVESELGKGTTFWISFDRVMEEVCLI